VLNSSVVLPLRFVAQPRPALHLANVLLVGQTFASLDSLLGGVPTRPSQNDPERVAAWTTHRRAVGKKIRALRLAQGLTQEALALRSGVTRNVLIDVESGRRGILYERLFDIAYALNLPISTLFEFDTPPELPDDNT